MLETGVPLFSLTLIGMCVLGLGTICLRSPRRPTVGWMLLGLSSALLAAFSDLQGKGSSVFGARIWTSGWLGPPLEVGSLSVGINQDFLGMSLAIFFLILASWVLLTLQRETQGARLGAPLRFGVGVLLVSTAGVGLSWIALTPWLGLFGISLCGLGGGCMAARVGLVGTTGSARQHGERFLVERMSGIVLSGLGAQMLASWRLPLVLDAQSDWHLPGPGGWGTIVLFIGLAVQLRADPDSLRRDLPSPLTHPAGNTDQDPRMLQLFLGQICPAGASFALLMRLEPALRPLALEPVLAGACLIFAALSWLRGLLQRCAWTAIGYWLSGAYFLALFALLAHEPQAALSAMVGASIGALLLGLGHPRGRLQAGLAAWMATGGPLSVGAFAGLRLMNLGMNQWRHAAWVVGLVFLQSLLPWIVAFEASRSPPLLPTHALHWALIAGSLLIGVFLSWGSGVWGALLGGLSGEAPFLNALCSSASNSVAHHSREQLVALSCLFWGIWGSGISVAYWLIRRADATGGLSWWKQLERLSPRGSALVAAGFYVDRIVRRACACCTILGGNLSVGWIFGSGVIFCHGTSGLCWS